jgi:uncharacterized protein (DUF1015 family)
MSEAAGSGAGPILRARGLFKRFVEGSGADALDVTVLHSLVLQHVLGLTQQTQAKQENVTYVRDAGEAVSRVLSGEHPIGFLLNPTPMWQVEAVGEAGETMPQKSTLFYPRLQSGLVMRDVNPRERP